MVNKDRSCQFKELSEPKHLCQELVPSIFRWSTAESKNELICPKRFVFGLFWDSVCKFVCKRATGSSVSHYQIKDYQFRAPDC